jgi:hypothetical protein
MRDLEKEYTIHVTPFQFMMGHFIQTAFNLEFATRNV